MEIIDILIYKQNIGKAYNKIIFELVTLVLKVSRIFNTYVITDTGCINHTIRKYNTSGRSGYMSHLKSYITLFMRNQSNETSTISFIMINVANIT